VHKAADQGANILDTARNQAHRSCVGAFKAFVPSRKLPVLPRSRKNRAGLRRPIAGGSSNVGLVRFASTRFVPNRRRGLAAMTAVPNDARLLGPADRTRIDVNAPAEMRHWVRELGKPAAQLKAAVAAVGPLVADVREYLQRRRLYGLPR
jgi:hypothetical protein